MLGRRCGCGGAVPRDLFFCQLILGIPEQALSLLHMAIEPILADGAVLDKGRAMFLVAKCQVASAASYDPAKKVEGKRPSPGAQGRLVQETPKSGLRFKVFHLHS